MTLDEREQLWPQERISLAQQVSGGPCDLAAASGAVDAHQMHFNIFRSHLKIEC